MFKNCITISFLFLSSLLYSQIDISDLSTKERLKIAEKEEREAKNDPEFKQLMNEGHTFFEGKHYLKAIHKYEDAGKLRPYNVYPPVIITDIELSMADTLKVLRKAEEIENQKLRNSEAKPTDKEANEEFPPAREETKEERIQKINDWERKEREKLENQRKAEENMKEESPGKVSTSDVKVMSPEEYKIELGKEFPEGITEEVYKEGNKTITRRILVKEGKGNEYKKVVHEWGGLFYFKNGEPITERVWSEEVGKQN